MPRRPLNLPAPYLRRVWLDPARIPPGGREKYPFGLPLFPDDFEIAFEKPITILVGENGSGKSTFLEALAVLVGFDEAGGAAGYRPVDHSDAVEATGGQLAQALRASWLPRMNTGWFFKAETFFSVARYLDQAAAGAGPPPDFLSHSHGEGFLRFFEERCRRQGIYIFDEPESALSPSRQVAFLKLLGRMERSGIAQVILATHATILMAYPGATLLEVSARGFQPTTLEDTSHYKLMRAFSHDAHGFVARVLRDEAEAP
ncbi:AAA family ATPase [Beijerinckia sp. L45]|uniref:AAA family ATPase n=1 Tax=Beijerinckia sp. L45 TaxID=1641855 RepID=UPI00131ABAB0|nr:AAA family ATPase [Beijerinckia sp. L45]